jgi:hypothetical protein
MKKFIDMKKIRTYFVKTLIALSCVILFASCEETEDVSKGTACDILEFKIGELSWTIGEQDITHVYPSAILPTPLTPTTITVSPGATINPSQGVEQNNFFKEGGVEYVVTAEDRVTTKIYKARAIRTQYTECEIISFTAGGVAWTIEDTLITYIFPSTARETTYAPMVELSPGSRITPVTTEAQNFFTTQGVKYTVMAEDGKSSKTYTVRARKIYTGCDILTFSVNGVPWSIRGTSIAYAFPDGTPEAVYTPIITLSDGAKINPSPNEAQNFFKPEGVTYTVTAEDSTKTRTYTVRARTISSDCNIVSFSAGGAEWTVNNVDLTVTHVFQGGKAGPLRPTITLPDGAAISPSASEMQDFFTESGVVYTVTAEDGVTEKTYTVKASIVPVKYNTSNWVVSARHGSNFDWGEGSGDQEKWFGGHPMLILDDDAESGNSGWRSFYDEWVPFPQILIIDMKESKQITEIIGRGEWLNNVQLYLTDDLSIPEYQTYTVDWNSNLREDYYRDWFDGITPHIPGEPRDSWGSPIAESSGSNDFSFDFPQMPEGRYLIVLFDGNTVNDGYCDIIFYNLEVYGY